MLQNWVGGACVRGKVLPHSYPDRGGAWSPAAPIQTAAHGRNDHGAIAQGVLAGTLIASDLGWVRAETLLAGDRVMTFDHGLQPLRSVRINTLWTAEDAAPDTIWPVLVPAGAIGNRNDLALLPEQAVLLESDAAAEIYGDPFTLVVAGALAGWRGVTRIPPQRKVTVVDLEFDAEQIVYANGTALLHCPAGHARSAHATGPLVDLSRRGYARLPLVQSEHLLQRMMAR